VRSGEVVWVGAGALGRNSGKVALYFRDDAEAIGPRRTRASGRRGPRTTCLRERLSASPCFFTDFLAELALTPEEVQEALWDLVWAGEVTNDAWAPLRARASRLARASAPRSHAARTPLRLAPAAAPSARSRAAGR
jgi:ATP-dependent Lhr-like helicase